VGCLAYSNPKIIYSNYISYKSKEQTQRNGFAHFEKTISQVFEASDIYMFIAEITSLGFKISKQNHKNYLALFFQCLRQITNHWCLRIDVPYKT